MQKRWMTFLTALLLPVIGMAYLYSRNAEYLSHIHVLALTALLALISAAGYGLLRRVFRSDVSAMAGCLAAWIAFFAFGAGLYDALYALLGSYNRVLMIYIFATLLAVALAAWPARSVKGDAMPTLVFMIACVMLLLNGYPALRTGIAQAVVSEEDARFKTEFQVDEQLPSPNVYWIHADGMLGFDAFEQYFGDDQAEFAQALAQRGFAINPSAYAELAHKTAVAVPGLMSPYFYDNTLEPLLRDHEDAMKLTQDVYFHTHQLFTARIKNETRSAFEDKGYNTQTIGRFSAYFPPTTTRSYIADGTGAVQAQVLQIDDAEHTFQSIEQLAELADLLIKKSDGVLLTWLIRLQDRFGLDLGIGHAPITFSLPKAQREALFRNASRESVLENGVLFDALGDALRTEVSPSFSMMTIFTAHRPFRFTEDGQNATGDREAIGNYPGSHRYTAKLLLGIADMILAHDPDAVIVLQADHGLNGQSRQEITDAFGADAVLPIWNQVMSAMRVPEAYKNGDEAYAMSNPLNISRYLMNRFVGERYPYLNQEEHE